MMTRQKNGTKDEIFEQRRRENKRNRSLVCYLPIKVFKNTHKSYLRDSFISLHWLSFLLWIISCFILSHLRSIQTEKSSPELLWKRKEDPSTNLNVVWCTISEALTNFHIYSAWKYPTKNASKLSEGFFSWNTRELCCLLLTLKHLSFGVEICAFC